MIFVLLIFTVGSNFQSTMGGLFGGGSGANRVELTWTDPLTSETHTVQTMEFLDTGNLLDALARANPMGLRLFVPWHAEPGKGPEEEDVALFLILEQLAENEGIDPVGTGVHRGAAGALLQQGEPPVPWRTTPA